MKLFLRHIFLITAMLMVVVGDVWAGNARIYAKSDPTEGGYVYVANSAGSYSINSSEHNNDQKGSFLSKDNKEFYLYYKVSDKYYFKGWYKTSKSLISGWASCDVNSTSLTANGQKVTHQASTGANNVSYSDYYYYAIFATLHNTTSPSFSTIDVDKTTTSTVTLKHAHANNVSLSITGDCASDFSINTNSFYSNQLGTQTITITFNPNCAGTRTANLKITNDNGLPEVNIPLSAVANVLPQTIAWDSQYDENMNVGGSLVVSATASTGQSVTYTSSDPSVISVSGNTLTALKEGAATITASQIDGCTYKTVHTQLEFKVHNKKTPVFWLMGDPDMESDNLKVEDSRWIKVENVDGLRAIYDPNLLSYSFDGDRVTITALDAGVATLELIQDPTDAIFDKSRTFTFYITKYTTNAISNDLAIQYMVDDVIPELDIYTINNLEVPVQVVSGDENVLKFENGQLKAVGAGKTTVTVLQAETNKWVGISASKTIEVIKHTPVFTWNTPVYFNSEVSNFFSTTGTNALTYYHSSDEDVATLSTGSNPQKLNLTTYNKEASTTLTVTQAENYYWYEKTETKVVTPIDPNNHVPFVMNSLSRREALFYQKETSNGEITCSEGGEIKLDQNGGIAVWTANPLYYTIKFTGIPDKLSFDYKQTATSTAIGATEKAFIVYQSTDGVAWNQVWTSDGMPDNTDYETKSDIQLNPETRYIKFFFDATYSGYYKNITVTELEEFHAVDKEDESKEVERLDFGANQVNIPATLKFDLKYANAGYKVKLESNDPRFTVEPTSINDIGGCRYGKREISVTYNSNVPCQIEGESSFLTITDEIGHSDKVYLVASSYKPAQTLEWRTDFKVEKPTIRLKDGQIADAATATSGMPVTYTSSNTEVIAISDDGKILIPKAEGEAAITATQAGNETWQPVSDTKTFIVTDKIIQYIGWSDALTDLIIGGPDVTLTAKVYLRDEATQTYYYSEERTKLLQYSVEDNNVVTVSGNVLSIKGVGQTTAIVVAPGDKDYAEATLAILVRVRTESAGCEDVLLLNHADDVEFFAYNTNEIIQGPFDIDRGKGVPGTLSFQHRGASWDLGIQYYGGTIKAQYVTDDNTTWTDAKEVTPIEDQATFESGISLPRNATQVRFVRPSGGTGYHYVSNIQVHPAQYLETQAEINFGEIHVGSTETKPLEVYYSNIKDVVAISASSGDVVVYPTSFGECGKYGKSTIDVTWIPSVVSADAQEQVTLRDNISGMESVVTLKAVVAKGTQNIYWPERPTTISNCGDIGFPEETTAHLSIIWEVISGQDVAKFNNGVLELYKSGTIKVRGYNTGNSNYHEFSVEYDFTVNYEPIFIGAEDMDWNNSSNWTICRVPVEEDVVTIQAPAELTTSARVKGINFVEGGTLHVASTGGMTVGEDGISGAVDGSIVIDNTPSGVGYLRIAPTANKPAKVTVKYTTKTYDNGWPRYEVWQYIGMPGENAKMEGLDNRVTFYNWDETRGWLKQNYTSQTNIPAWTGYAFTQSQEENATFNIVSEPIWADKAIDFTFTVNGMVGDNLMVNSYLAPIDITKIESTDVEDPHEVLTKTFFLFNAGSWSDWKSGVGDIVASGYDQSSAGHYYSIPFYSAKNMKSGDAQLVIPSMQGVYVYTEGPASLKLNYAKHVYAADEANNLNQPMRAPQQMYADSFRRVCIQAVSENSGADRMYVMQDMNTTADYDNGYDGDNIIASGQVNIYTNEHFGQMEVSCSNDIDSTYIGFTAGEDSEYSLNISAVVGDDMYLVDLDNENIIPLLEEQRYEFYAVPNSVNDRRFMLIKRSVSNPDNEQDGTPTDVQDLYYEQSLWIHDNILYISQAPMNSILSIYTVSGTLVATPQTISNAPYSQELNLPTGVYMLRLNDKVYKFVCK